MTIIKDGTGKGYLAKITSRNMLTTQTVSESKSEYIARTDGDFFIISSGLVTANSTNEHILIWFKNNNPDKTMYVEAFRYSYNGGSTNHNRVMKFGTYKNPSTPSANYTTLNIVNSNYNSTVTSGVTAYKWDGVGNGITIEGLPTPTSDHLAPQGLTIISTGSVPILGYGHSMAAHVTPEEIGTMAIVIRFYMSDSD